MPKADHTAAGCWIVASDAGTAHRTKRRSDVAQIAAYAVFRESTATIPIACGASFVGRTGTNKSEYFGALHGLRLVADRMELGDWSADPVHVLTDSRCLFMQATEQWQAEICSGHLDLLQQVEARIWRMTEQPVYYVHSVAGEMRSAHRLSKEFPKCCPTDLRASWAARAAAERWPDVLEAATTMGFDDLHCFLLQGVTVHVEGGTLVVLHSFNDTVAEDRLVTLRCQLRSTVSSLCAGVADVVVRRRPE